MTRFKIEFLSSAAKEFRDLSIDLKQRIGGAIESLQSNPLPSGVRKLSGHKRLYRIRVGDYRVVYEIDVQEKFIRVTRIRHRREVYH